jgi:PPP family 3-phenylpropionic acid transporter
MRDNQLPYWRLSNFYFFYFASLGALMPYLGLYLQSIGYSAWYVGLIIAVVQGTKIIAPNIWGWICDVKQNRMRVIQLGALISSLIFSFIFLEPELPLFILVMFGFSFFWNAIIPQFEAVTFTFLGKQTHEYSRIRVWGSIGFIFSVVSTGFLLDEFGMNAFMVIVLSLLTGIWFATLVVKERPTSESKKATSHIKEVLFNKPVIAFFVMCFLIQASHAPYYSFFSIYLGDQGYSKSIVGQFWSLGVIAEIILFFVMHHLTKRITLRRILLLSLCLTVLRWLLIGWCVDNLFLLLFAQLLHAASFGAFHVAAIQLVHKYFKDENQGRGQALFSSAGYGAGGMCGSLMAGYLWDSVGPSWVFTIAALLSLIAFVIAWLYVDRGDETPVDLTENDYNVV